jgi:hypothetical protein
MSLESVKDAAAVVVLRAVLVGYVSAGGAVIYFGFVTLYRAVVGY